MKNKTIIAYHGSPDVFKKFKLTDKKKSGQIGADLGIWFTTDIKVAKNFAQTFPEKYYTDLQKSQTKALSKLNKKFSNYTNEQKQEIEFWLNKCGYDLSDFDGNYEKGYDKVLSYFGASKRPEMTDSYYEFIVKPYKEYQKQHKELLSFEDATLAEWYVKNHKGNLYKVEIELGKTKTLSGTKIGTGWGRYDEILMLSYDYNTVIIKQADTGQGIADEIVVFTPKSIKVIETIQV